jgi:hypothetical protein
MTARREANRSRLRPCECCKYPISQVHHVLPFSEYGENPYRINVCANCHEAIHLCEQSLRRDGKPGSQAKIAWEHLFLKLGGIDNPTVLRIVEIAMQSLRLRQLSPLPPGLAPRVDHGY